MKMGLTWYTGLLVRFTSSAGWLLGRRSCHCGAFEPAYQSDPDGLLRTLNCCHGLGQEHAEQFVRLLHRPPTSNRLTRKYGSITTPDHRGGGFCARSWQLPPFYFRSSGRNPGVVDLVLLSNGRNAFQQVTGIPEPGSLTLLVISLVIFQRSRGPRRV